jgi:hypothetical protein
MGQYEAAYKAAKDARTWSIIGAVVSVVFGIIYGFCLVVAGI